MLGAIIGDIAGSTREFNNTKTEDFELIPSNSHFTDDTVMTLAVASWLMNDSQHRSETLINAMQQMGRTHINAGYGKLFKEWILCDSPNPYGSYGNGSAMRVSPVGLYASTLEETLSLATTTAKITHNHPEGIKGAKAVATCVYLNKIGETKQNIKKFVQSNFGYDLERNLEDLRPTYSFDSSCQGSVPIAIQAFLERDEVESILRLAISMGGDTDTIAAIACSIATANPSCKFNKEIETKCKALLPIDLLNTATAWESFISTRKHQIQK